MSDKKARFERALERGQHSLASLKIVRRFPTSPPEIPLAMAEVANLVAGPKAPSWLVRYFLEFAPSVVIDRVVAAKQPGRAEMANFLKKIEKAALLLVGALSDGAQREFLEMPPLGEIEKLPVYEKVLGEIAQRARVALASQALLNKAKKTKAGRGRALTEEAIAPRMWCAIIVGEAWTHFHPSSAFRSRNAVAAVDAYWRACGGEYTGSTNDPSEGWRPYFKKFKEPAAAKYRADCRRYIVESEHQEAILHGTK